MIKTNKTVFLSKTIKNGFKFYINISIILNTSIYKLPHLSECYNILLNCRYIYNFSYILFSEKLCFYYHGYNFYFIGNNTFLYKYNKLW
jgi:hypothetical protein